MDWDKLRIFHAAAEAGSFTHAGDALHMSQSAISRQVSALEKDVGVSLFHRHARGLVLTEQGELLYRTASEVLSKLAVVEGQLADATSRPQGDLRVAAPVGLGSIWLTQRLRDFYQLYPDIHVELILVDEHIDISMRAADVGLWISEPEQSELIRRPLFTMHTHAYASAQYIRRKGAPQSLRDLGRHNLVSFSGNPPAHLQGINQLETLGRDGQERRVPVFRANSILALRQAVCSGIGIGIISDYLTEEAPDLVPVLQDLDLPTLPVYFVYAEEMRASKRLQVFRDFLVSQAKQWKY